MTAKTSEFKAFQKFGRIRRFRQDKDHRRKCLVTFAVYGSYVMLGWVVLQIGTALPDLQQLAQINLESASWLFTCWSIGFLPGSLLFGILYDKTNRLLIIMLCSIGSAICSLILPYSPSFPVMICLRVIAGFLCGGIDTGANTIVPSIWGRKCGPYMQALYLFYTLGGIAAPFATEPFMTSKQSSSNSASSSNISLLVSTQPSYESHVSLHPTVSNNQSVVILDNWNKASNISIYLDTTEHSNIADNSTDVIRIHSAFLLTSILVAATAIPYLLMLIKGGYLAKVKACENGEVLDKLRAQEENHVNNDQPDESDTQLEVYNVVTNQQCELHPLQQIDNCVNGETDKVAPNQPVKIEIVTARQKLPKLTKYFILACVAGVNLTYSATEHSLGDFAVTFCRNYFGWDNGPSVTLVSLYWTGSCLGGVCGVFLVRILGPTKLLFVAMSFWISSFLATLLSGVFMIDTIVWISVPVSGFFMVQIVPSTISWTEKNICEISGKVAAVVMISTGIGQASNPNLIGYMMEKYSYACLVYILFAEALLCSSLFLIGYIRKRLSRTLIVCY